MLFTLAHGQHAFRAGAGPRRAGTATAPSAAPPLAAAPPPSGAPVPETAVAPDLAAAAQAEPELEPAGDGAAAVATRALRAAPAPRAEEAAPGLFRYFFPDAPALPERPDMAARLDALADSMVEADADPADANSALPPVLTYFGQFIDHDITAGTDRETALSVIEGDIGPLPRAQVEAGLANLRDGSLALDSLYGGTTGQHAFAAKLSGLMRRPSNRAQMRLDVPAPVGDRVPLPATDDATDLLRLGRLLEEGRVTLAELQALEPGLRDVFLRPDGSPRLARAVMGDGRNDENLAVAQLHVLFLRLHNTLAVATGSRSFARAQRLTRWHYQWLVIHDYLRHLCDEAVLDEILALGAPRFAAFLDRHGAEGPQLPMPLEFSVAAFRFGHSMVRGAYDYNRVFGEAADPPGEHFLDAAPFGLLFGFTGTGEMNGDAAAARLPRNWVIEWERWMRTDEARPHRSARRIDTHLAPPLRDMANEAPTDPQSLFRHLARRNLRRGYRLALPSAQGCAAAIAAAGYAPVPLLSPEEIGQGSPARQEAVTAGGFDTATPLWFYVLREAEAAGGERLGPLGTHLVAETLVGLIASDPDSYWNAEGGRWSPAAFRPEDPIDSLEAVARVCGMM